MSAIQHITIDLAMPSDLERFTLPAGVHQRLQDLLDRQDHGDTLSTAERSEAEGLVNLSELFSLLRLRATRTLLA